MAQDLFGFRSGSLRDFPHQSARGAAFPVQGHHVPLGVKIVSCVDLPVEMDRHVRNQQRVPVQVHKPRNNTVPFPDRQASGYGKRPVQPGGHDHAAVSFHIHADIAVVPVLKLLLQFERRGIPVRRHDAEGRESGFRHGKGNHRRIVPDHIVFSAGVHQPGIRFLQLLIAVFPQHLREVRGRVERRRRLLRKRQEPFHQVHTSFLRSVEKGRAVFRPSRFVIQIPARWSALSPAPDPPSAGLLRWCLPSARCPI